MRVSSNLSNLSFLCLCRDGLSFAVAEMVCLSFAIAEMVCLSFAIAEMVCLSFAIAEMVCLYFAIAEMVLMLQFIIIFFSLRPRSLRKLLKGSYKALIRLLMVL